MSAKNAQRELTMIPKAVEEFLKQISDHYDFETSEANIFADALFMWPDSPVKKLIDKAILVDRLLILPVDELGREIAADFKQALAALQPDTTTKSE